MGLIQAQEGKVRFVIDRKQLVGILEQDSIMRK